MDRCADQAGVAANAILELLGTGEGEGGKGSGLLRPWQSISPVFASIAAPKLHIMLREVYSMMQQESEVKGSICQVMIPLDYSSQSDSPVISSRVYDALLAASDDELGEIKGKEDGLLRKCLSVALTSWSSSPYISIDRYQELIRVIADEMNGF